MSEDSAPRVAWVLLGLVALVTPPAIVARAAAEQEPFRAGVVLLTIDVQITASKEASLREFAAGDFEVIVSGRQRPVASAARLHFDEGAVTLNQPRPGPASDAGCVFEFHRKTDRPTAHYRLAIQPVDADRSTREVRVRMADSAFATEWLVWRLPMR